MVLNLIPMFRGLDWWSDFGYPSGICDRPFRLELPTDHFSPSGLQCDHVLKPRRRTIRQAPYTVSRRVSCLQGSEVVNNSDKFQVSIDTNDYDADDITVKTVDNYVVVRGKHEEKADGQYISRQFTRKYMLPEDVQPEGVTSSLSSEGILTVEAPKIKGHLPSNEKNVPILRKETALETSQENKDKS